MQNKICFASVDVEGGIGQLDGILDIFEKYKICATLFATGEVLQKYPKKAKAWSQNHEIASHGFTHRFWNALSPKERIGELDQFINLYRDIFQKKPAGFRAPSHLIDEEGVRLLEEKGFSYDSSVVPHYPPFKKYRGYKGRKPLMPYFSPGRGILEIPVRGQMLGIPLAGAWISRLPFWFYQVLFFIYCPNFITVSIHSWDKLNSFEKILSLLKRKGYQFLNGEQILRNYR